MTRLIQIAAVAGLAVLVQGCSSASNLLGVGKSSPDESQIRTTQSLSMPPDLQLRAPSGQTVEEDGQLASAARSTAAAAPPADATVDAGTVDTGVDVDPAPSTAVAAAPAAPPQDIYDRYGISKTKPDGTPKKQEELFAELRAAKEAEKRRANPNYGTIFNIGELFKDG